MASKRALLEEIQSHARAVARAVNTATAAGMRLLAETDEQLHRELEEAQALADREARDAKEAYDATIARVRNEFALLDQQAGSWGAPWDAAYWDEYRAPVGPPLVTRLGKFQLNGSYSKLVATAYLRFSGGGNLIVKGPSQVQPVASGLIQSVLGRLLLTIPPAKMRMLLIDPEGSGQNVAGLMPLGEYMEELITSRAWTQASDIERQLANISLHMETVIQKFLQNQYPSIEDYNEKAGEIAEPYRIVAIFNYPFNFNDEAARRLVTITRNGTRCGVYTYMTVNTDRQPPYGFTVAELERDATVIAWNGHRFVWQDPDFQDLHFEPDAPFSPERMVKLIRQLGPVAKEASVVQVPFLRIGPGRQTWWTGNTSGGIAVPIGRAGAKQLQMFELGTGTAAHALVAGRTGSGKSTLLHVLILSLGMTYPHDELQLYLVDFKKGVEFKDYAPLEGVRAGLPHARVVAIESEREFGLSCVAGLVAEMLRRGDVFREAGAANLTEYRAKTGEKMPRIVLLVDEFHEFFLEDDAISREAALHIERLARESRAFGIHMVLASQSLAGARGLSRAVLDQMAVRVALQCSDSDSRVILADQNDAARLLTRPGEAIYNASNGLKEGNQLFQIGWLTDQERADVIQELAELGQASQLPRFATVVFEGNAPARLEDSPLDSLLEKEPELDCRRPLSCFVGQPVAIKEPTAAHFSRRTGRNLLVVGRDETTAMAMLLASLLSICASRRADQCSLYIADLSSADAVLPVALQSLAALMPHSLRFAHRRQLQAILTELQQVVSKRTESDRTSEPPVLLIGVGLHRSKDLTRETSYAFDGTTSGPTLTERLSAILRDGPEVGVHVIAWWDSLSSVHRALDPRSLGEFGLRVCLPMSSEDSSQLLDSPAAAKLGPHRALLADEERPGQLEKFIPYGMPPTEWLTGFCRRLTERRG